MFGTSNNSRPKESKVPTILCVDDNLCHLSLITALFEMQGYSVLCTDDPQEAIDLVGKVFVDLAVVDYELPHMNGAMLARKLRAISPNILILLCSGCLLIGSEDLNAVDEYIAKGESSGMLLVKTRCLLNLAWARAVGDSTHSVISQCD